MTEQSADLLPCPFCGGDPQRGQSADGGYFIECDQCSASTPLVYACGDDPEPVLSDHWNRRAMIAASPPAPVDDDRLREIRERLREWARNGASGSKIRMAKDMRLAADTIASLQARVGELEGERDSLRKRLDEAALLGIEQVMMRAENRRRAEAAEAERDRRGELLREAQNELNIIGSYAYDPETPLGLRATAKAYNRLITRIDATLKDTTHPETDNAG